MYKLSDMFSFLVSWGGMRLSPPGTSATNWPIVPSTDDGWCVWSSRWNENWQGKPKYSEKTCTGATLSTTNPTWPDLGSNPGRRGGKPATNRLNYGVPSPVKWHTLPSSLQRLCFKFRSFGFLLLGTVIVVELKKYQWEHWEQIIWSPCKR
jgi:hypothetical protein